MCPVPYIADTIAAYATDAAANADADVTPAAGDARSTLTVACMHGGHLRWLKLRRIRSRVLLSLVLIVALVHNVWGICSTNNKHPHWEFQHRCSPEHAHWQRPAALYRLC